MLDSIRDLLKRMQTDDEFKARVETHRQRKLEEKRPAQRRNSAKYEATHKLELSARKAVLWATKTGALVRPTKCSKEDGTCDGPIEAHHHLGYQEKLDVVWLCRRHHRKLQGLG